MLRIGERETAAAGREENVVKDKQSPLLLGLRAQGSFIARMGQVH